MKKLYPIISDVDSIVEEEMFKYFHDHQITYSIGETHRLIGPDDEEHDIRFLSVEMSLDEMDEFDKEFCLIHID